MELLSTLKTFLQYCGDFPRDHLAAPSETFSKLITLWIFIPLFTILIVHRGKLERIMDDCFGPVQCCSCGSTEIGRIRLRKYAISTRRPKRSNVGRQMPPGGATADLQAMSREEQKFTDH